jgi:hypothetical protein
MPPPSEPPHGCVADIEAGSDSETVAVLVIVSVTLTGEPQPAPVAGNPCAVIVYVSGVRFENVTEAVAGGTDCAGGLFAGLLPEHVTMM